MTSRILHLIWAFLLIAFSSCSTIRVNYEADFQTDNNKSGKIEYKNSYKVGGGTRILCVVTGIIYGGSCWMYLGMPNAEHRSMARSDAERTLREELGASQVTTSNISIRRLNWSEEEPMHQITLAGQSENKPVLKSMEPKMPTKKDAPKSKEENLDGFLR